MVTKFIREAGEQFLRKIESWQFFLTKRCKTQLKQSFHHLKIIESTYSFVLCFVALTAGLKGERVRVLGNQNLKKNESSFLLKNTEVSIVNSFGTFLPCIAILKLL